MEKIIIDRLRELKQKQEELEKKLNVKISIKGKVVTIVGKPFDEYEAMLVLEAIQFGFPTKKAVSLKEEEVIFRKIPIKEFTRRRNLKDVRGRVIGKEGKTKRTIEQIAGCEMIIKDNTIGLLGPTENIEEATTALQNLIRGSKQANVYKYLEKINTRKKFDSSRQIK